MGRRRQVHTVPREYGNHGIMGGLATGHEASLSFPSVHWEPDYTVDMQEEVGSALWAGITIKGGSGERER